MAIKAIIYIIRKRDSKRAREREEGIPWNEDDCDDDAFIIE